MEPQPNQVKSGQEQSSLKGTLAGVLFIGGFIVLSWFSVFFLYLSRM